MPAVDALARARDDLDLIAGAAREAGALAMTFYRREPRQWTKAGQSPVCEADIAVDRMLARTLRAVRPEYGWLSEETADDSDRLDARRVFVVDPIDGTRGYLAGSADWCVSISVVEDSRPLAGILCAPARGETMTALRGAGAWRNDRPLRALQPQRLEAGRVAAPRRMLRQLHGFDGYREENAPKIGSLALRIAMVATGRFDAAFASADAHDWDLAAADLILAEAGGRLSTFCGDEARYNAAIPRHPALVASAGAALHPRLVTHLRAGRERNERHAET